MSNEIEELIKRIEELEKQLEDALRRIKQLEDAPKPYPPPGGGHL